MDNLLKDHRYPRFFSANKLVTGVIAVRRRRSGQPATVLFASANEDCTDRPESREIMPVVEASDDFQAHLN